MKTEDENKTLERLSLVLDETAEKLKEIQLYTSTDIKTASGIESIQNIDYCQQIVICASEFLKYLSTGKGTPDDLTPTDIANFIIYGEEICDTDDEDCLF